MNRSVTTILLAGIITMAGCTQQATKQAKGTFGDDVAFLRKHTRGGRVAVLSDSSGKAQVVVSAPLQGRVMTSTADGKGGLSYGWINRELIASGKVAEHINVFGGEDRFWIGPEGGQFSIFFKKGVPFDLEHWYTPGPIDTEPFELVEKSSHHAVFRKDMQLTNTSEATFKLRVDREVRVLEKDAVTKALGVNPAKSVRVVAFESDNRMTNVGEKPWSKDTGLLSIWILGMFNPSPAMTVVVPFKRGRQSDLGVVVNDSYFGKVPADRLVVKQGVLFFKGDGQYRSKIGLAPQRALAVLGSYDAQNKVLTIVQYNKPEGADYVNSMWELQKEPYKGDVVNSYNDGPAGAGGKPLGPFYELETSSPAAALQPGRIIQHVHRTVHLQGDESELDPIAKSVLGVTIAQITSAFVK